jgi:PIN domain nuclease of toxin-antitoxin system
LRLLVDTHALIWWLLDDSRLSRAARSAITANDAEVLVSAVSAFEIAIKNRLGKLPEMAFLLGHFAETLDAQGFQPLDVTPQHGLAAGQLPFAHGDPFDRLLVAQALVEGLTLVSNERPFDATGVQRLW